MSAKLPGPAYYNEVDAFPAQWLRNLLAAGHIAAGHVDDRSIKDVQPDDLRGFAQCHFFAGIGGWSRALRIAGVPDDLPLWTGSCPCQPFSVAGKQRGFSDPRHLWPEWFRLIRECRPPSILGEQVGGTAGLAWLDVVFADLEGIGYACGAANLPAACVGAPHIRQRLFFVANLLQEGRGQRRFTPGPAEQRNGREPIGRREADELADAECEGTGRDAGTVPGPQGEGCGERFTDGRIGDGVIHASADGSLANANESGLTRARQIKCGCSNGNASHGDITCRCGASFWSDIAWLPCSDGKARPTQPGIEPLAHGVPGRVGRLRGYGNAIVPQVAAAFIASALEALPCP